ncbi:MAG: HNH endonuclease [Bacteroidota bacterium]
MNAFVAITDSEWFDLLASQPGIDEINFWQPGGKKTFRSLNQGEFFLFKPHRRNVIIGGGFFAYSTLLPITLAWETFGIGNGATSLEEMRQRIKKYRRQPSRPHEDYTIGCILLSQPFFFKEQNWVPVPEDWKSNIVQGRSYDVTQEPGLSMYKNVIEHIRLSHQLATIAPMVAEPEARYGTLILMRPRLGQGAFRIVVTDAYERKCVVTGEKVLPVLQAAHIRPYNEGGLHQIDNGLLLRSDLHTLLDRGYVTVTPDYHIEVSRHIREDYENGHEYYAFHGTLIREPRIGAPRPSRENLIWHNENRYLS